MIEDKWRHLSLRRKEEWHNSLGHYQHFYVIWDIKVFNHKTLYFHNKYVCLIHCFFLNQCIIAVLSLHHILIFCSSSHGTQGLNPRHPGTWSVTIKSYNNLIKPMTSCLWGQNLHITLLNNLYNVMHNVTGSLRGQTLSNTIIPG